MPEDLKIAFTPLEACIIDAAVYWFVHEHMAGDGTTEEVAGLKVQMARVAAGAALPADIMVLARKMAAMRDFASNHLTEVVSNDLLN